MKNFALISSLLLFVFVMPLHAEDLEALLGIGTSVQYTQKAACSNAKAKAKNKAAAEGSSVGLSYNYSKAEVSECSCEKAGKKQWRCEAKAGLPIRDKIEYNKEFSLQCSSGKSMNVKYANIKGKIARFKVEGGKTHTFKYSSIEIIDDKTKKASSKVKAKRSSKGEVRDITSMLCEEPKGSGVISKAKSKLSEYLKKDYNKYCKKNPKKCTPHSGDGSLGVRG